MIKSTNTFKNHGKRKRHCFKLNHMHITQEQGSVLGSCRTSNSDLFILMIKQL